VTPLQIGITGGIGSGKSLICRIFQILGAPVYNADSRAKDLMTTDGILISRIKKEFGELSYRQDGSLHREYLSEKVFNDTERLKVLNGLVHPRVAEDYTQWVDHHQRVPYVIKEAALLFEAGSYKTLDKVIVVYAPSSVRIKRVLSRDKHRTETQVREIMKNQLSDEDILARADFIIRNDESQLVITQVLDLHHRFSTMHRTNQ
jgi:dephospho-CoA kinase